MLLLAETLPWSLYFHSFTGTLPNIIAMYFLLDAMQFRWGKFFNQPICLYITRATRPLTLGANRNERTSQITSVLMPGPAATIASTDWLCPNETQEVSLSGAGVMTVGGSGEGIFLTLIS